MYDKDKDFYPNDTGWLGYGNVSICLCCTYSII